MNKVVCPGREKAPLTAKSTKQTQTNPKPNTKLFAKKSKKMQTHRAEIVNRLMFLQKLLRKPKIVIMNEFFFTFSKQMVK